MSAESTPAAKDSGAYVGGAGDASMVPAVVPAPDAAASRELTVEQRGRLYELAAEVARLICVDDAQYVDDKKAHCRLDLAANEIGYLLGLSEPEFENLWRGGDGGTVRKVIP